MHDHFENIKEAVLDHIANLFEEIEQETVVSHQEKYALLEDAFEQASDADELRVAFDQWYSEHADDIGFDHDADELWDHAVGVGEEILDDDEDEKKIEPDHKDETEEDDELKSAFDEE